MKNQTAVEQLVNFMKDNFHLTDESLIKFEQAKAMEKEQIIEYAKFCIHCDRNKLPLLDFEGFLTL